jgi:hypothetical protein
VPSGTCLVTARAALAVGPTGSDVSYDGGRTWARFDTGSFDAVACAAGGSWDGGCWASGENGRVARLRGGHEQRGGCLLRRPPHARTS